MKNAILIDGNSLAYRAYFATWQQVEFAKLHNLPFNNAIRTMLMMCWNLLQSKQYDYGVISFDTKAPTFRDQLYSEYKSKRSKTPSELLVQIPVVKESLRHLGFLVCEQDGFEADDLIGSYARLMTQNNVAVDIYSSDRDLLQLVDSMTSVWLCVKGTKEMKEYNTDNFAEQFFGLTPKQVIEYKGLVGDNSDNLTGIKGIGPKKGIDLLKQYGTIDNIFANFDKLSKALQTILQGQIDTAKKFSFLASIKTDIKLNDDIVHAALKPIDKQALLELLDKYGIKALAQKFSQL
ncbi:5'-3' exonuclease [Mycoplasmoides pneumoniae]|uniref:5'-3' exonuclease n=4 Tax=Mycoplasmoides pneumoniae TaxID=2104 RepID=EX53_MYCPN|nr:5'-3' exonuclease [Mycoplasmoides pneumoniae]P75403.1 RecName: Full=5'-3' exonuclease [Mycoplasmoides pneumoniae M129]AAB96106.1 5'-3' exonuclease [Mycoplasmoides pneumoniae M129]ADK86859.1 5'-3' exonuclease, SAM domain protein [Mycoplasmoides pneumoniae FH]AGC04287.1 5'-3' exonuclease [Mycoplasmoides pneumoniae M129-B7]ALA30258.1 5'-3' exonuclease [Mycoplasmoides pneumoniae PI 1428]ALA31207.1 5'-3' exonuclease [Mycoplasmoides pneumoniae 19294]